MTKILNNGNNRNEIKNESLPDDTNFAVEKKNEIISPNGGLNFARREEMAKINEQHVRKDGKNFVDFLEFWLPAPESDELVYTANSECEWCVRNSKWRLRR